MLPRRKSGVQSSPGLNDNFSGSAGSIAGRTPVVGGPWEIGSGTVTTNGSGQLTVAGSEPRAVSESRLADGTITLTMTSHATNAGGLVFRWQDASNYWRAQIAGTTAKLMEVVNGVANQRATVAVTGGTGTIIVTLSGSSISVTGTLMGAGMNFTSSSFAAATRHGVYGGAAGPTFDSIVM
jgi:hypothetical protein